MFSKPTLLGQTLLAVVLASTPLLSQQTSGAPSSTPSATTSAEHSSTTTGAPSTTTSAAAALELPVVMKQNVTAGKTPAGTKVQAKLIAATLVEGVVIPRDALLSGEVIESLAKTETDPSRLGIRIDSAQWKNGSARLKVYLTAWYYPEEVIPPQSILYTPADAATNNRRTWNGMGTYPDPNNPVALERFPAGDTSEQDKKAPPTATVSSTGKRRAPMKNITSVHGSDGSLEITCSHSNIKLDKLTTYVLASADLTAPK
jgi:hypothetical protein